jgi:predicted TIM-barrel fold metal-dependent hydrolase
VVADAHEEFAGGVAPRAGHRVLVDGHRAVDRLEVVGIQLRREAGQRHADQPFAHLAALAREAARVLVVGLDVQHVGGGDLPGTLAVAAPAASLS